MNAHMVADDYPRACAGAEDRVCPVVLLAARQEMRAGRVTVEVEHDNVGVAVSEMEVCLAARVNGVAFGYALVRELMEIIVERRPAEGERIACLMVAGRRHNGHLAQKLCTGSEEIVVPVSVVALAADEVAVHESDIAVEVADEILHVRPVVARIAVDVADGEYAVGCAGFGCGFGAADLVKAACGTGAYGEVVAGVGLQVGECDNVYKAFAGYVPTAVAFGSVP